VGGWRRLHNEELHNLYASPNTIMAMKSRSTKWAWHVARMGKMRHAHTLLVSKPEGRRPLVRYRRRWEDNTGMDLWDVGWVNVERILLTKDRDQWRDVMIRGNVPSGSTKGREFLD